jgi:hypothetical protein
VNCLISWFNGLFYAAVRHEMWVGTVFSEGAVALIDEATGRSG